MVLRQTSIPLPVVPFQRGYVQRVYESVRLPNLRRKILDLLIDTDIWHVDVPDGFKEPEPMTLSARFPSSHTFTLCIFDLALFRRCGLHV
jgi:hypothetical protein